MAKQDEPLSGILTEMTIEEVRALAPKVVLVPIGSTEPHGPHLPYGTDTFQVEAVARLAVVHANKLGARTLMYPTLPVSNNVNVKAFPFACRVSVRTLMHMMLDIIQALEEDGIKRIVLLNGHGGNPDTLQAVIREHVSLHKPGEGAFVCMTTPGACAPKEVCDAIEHPSDHAGENETSRMMHLRPDLVRTALFDNFPMQSPELQKLQEGRVFFVRPWHGYLPVSAGGETRKSTAAKGKALTEQGALWLGEFLHDLANAPDHDLFPYPKGEPAT